MTRASRERVRRKIEYAKSCLDAHLANPCRDGESCGYQIEKAILLLIEAHKEVIRNDPSATGKVGY